MRVFLMLMTLVVIAIVIHNYFGGFTSRNQDSAQHFSKAAQSQVSDSVSEYEKNLKESMEKAGAE